MYNRFITLFILLIILSASALAQQKPEVADRIVALVSGTPVLKSEIDAQVIQYIQQARYSNDDVQFTEELWYNVLQATIDNKVMLEKAELDSIVVEDDMVNRRMNARIEQLIQQAGSERALEQAFGKSLIQLRADYREQFREDIKVEQVRRNKIQSISITRPEVQQFFDNIPQDSVPIIPEQVSISQIVSLPPPKADAKAAAYAFANLLRDSLLIHNVPFEELARRHSDGPSAPRGGLLPLMDLNQLVSEYSAAASALQPGEISEVVETQFGLHLIRLNRRVGDQIETNNLLITIDEDELDEQVSIDKLTTIRDSLLTIDSLRFDEMARRHSEDPLTASSGGKIVNPQTGERLIPLQALDPSLYRVVLLMDEVGQISEPRSFNPGGANSGKAFRIVRLDNRIEEHTANMEQDYDRIESYALQQKQMVIFEQWLKDLRNDIYIEYTIPVPEYMKL
jgi:peptidyl-prolyl cis-trans isomerase SurA